MIRLSVPDVGKEEIEEVSKVLDSKYLVQGEKVHEFESMVSDFLNIKNCIAVSSGTAALHLALLSSGIKAGDEVIVPDFTFPATANVCEIVGAQTKFVDIKPDSFCIDEEKIEESITQNTKAIVPVHEFGQSADMDSIMALAEKYKLKVIEDAACSLGSEYKGRMAGTIGDIGCFSFHPRKAVTTGEGGIIATRDDELAEKIKMLRNHGIRYVNGKTEFAAAGFNYRMTDIQGALGVAQMKKLKNIINYRRVIAMEYEKLLKGNENLILPQEKSYGKHIYQTYHILLNKGINRDSVKEKLRQKGIESSLGAYAVHQQRYYKEKYNYESRMFVNSLSAYNHGLAIPMHCELDPQKVEFICSSLEAILESF